MGKHDGGAFIARLPGFNLAVRNSYFRHACSKRWGWIAVDKKTGKVLAKSRITRYCRSSLAMAGGLRWVREHRPDAYKMAMAAGDVHG